MLSTEHAKLSSLAAAQVVAVAPATEVDVVIGGGARVLHEAFEQAHRGVLLFDQAVRIGRLPKWPMSA